MNSILETIHNRRSVRTFNNQEVPREVIQQIDEFLQSNNIGPFGNIARFKIIEVPSELKKELKEYGSYSVISGTKLFIAGAVKSSPMAMEDFGYCMEKAMLFATSQGLGTVWLGGSLNRSTFGVKLDVTGDELIPAVTPLGYAGDKRSFIDNTIRFLAGSKNRKTFGELFFLGDVDTSLTSDSCGEYSKVLEAVRLGPSAGNKQPWRIIKEKESNTFHLYLKENPTYNNAFKPIKLQNVDMGIAICHFELSAKELGLSGRWMKSDSKNPPNGLQYISSWVG